MSKGRVGTLDLTQIDFLQKLVHNRVRNEISDSCITSIHGIATEQGKIVLRIARIVILA